MWFGLVLSRDCQVAIQIRVSELCARCGLASRDCKVAILTRDCVWCDVPARTCVSEPLVVVFSK